MYHLAKPKSKEGNNSVKILNLACILQCFTLMLTLNEIDAYFPKLLIRNQQCAMTAAVDNGGGDTLDV